MLSDSVFAKDPVLDHTKPLQSDLDPKNIFEHTRSLDIELMLADLDASFLNISGEQARLALEETSKQEDLTHLPLVEQLKPAAFDSFTDFSIDTDLHEKNIGSMPVCNIQNNKNDEDIKGIPFDSRLSDAMNEERLGLNGSINHNHDVVAHENACNEQKHSEFDDRLAILDSDKSATHVNGECIVNRVSVKSTASSDSTSQDSLLDDTISNCTQSLVPSIGTPDSLDSLDVQNILETEESHKFVPSDKPADSGYETENLESPEWTSHVNGPSSHTLTDLETSSFIAPVIIISEVGQNNFEVNEGDLDIKTQNSADGAYNSYRDSAYFSDNDSEPEKKPDVLENQASDIKNASISHTFEETKNKYESRPRKVLVPGDWAEHLSQSSENAKQATQTPISESTADDDISEQDEEIVNPFGPSEVFCSMNSIKDIPFLSHSEGQKLKEPDMEGKYLGKLDAAGLLDLSEDGMDADEEDENSDDSDDDIRAFTLHSFSSDSEDDTVHPVPVVHMETDDGKNLKSLMKPHKPASSRLFGKGKSKKTVSFFDDVTIYLFDQETPTKDLGSRAVDSSSPVSNNSQSSPSAAAGSRFTNSESSTDEEGGAFEWDDDFPSPDPSFLNKPTANLIGSKLSVNPSKYFSPPPPSRSSDENWTHASSYSRFSISPANIASFSLTHLTDSDIEQGGK
ncbi:unnamed protein product, partial [Staurois parvus]